MFTKLISSEFPTNDFDVSLYGQFVGEWDFDWSAPLSDGTVKRHKGEWIFSYILEGKAIQDLFICPSLNTRVTDYDEEATFGTTIRSPLADGTGMWQITYINDKGQKIDHLNAIEIDGNIIQTGINYDPKDETIWQWNFKDITKNSFYWESIWSKDQGKTWNLCCELTATRRK